MKKIQGCVRVKINEYVHAWSEFLFVSLLLIFNFFPQIDHFYYFTSLLFASNREKRTQKQAQKDMNEME